MKAIIPSSMITVTSGVDADNRLEPNKQALHSKRCMGSPKSPFIQQTAPSEKSTIAKKWD